MSRRLRLVPEVIQASAMDCGPAALAALLAASGRPVNVERLHDACATAVDGTSIRTLGLLGQRLGLALSQEIVPIEHFASALPCIAMTRQPDGSRHFVVVWSRQLRWYQVMDPAEGRRWVHEDSLLPSLYTHTECYALEQWERWAQSPEVEARNRQLWKEVGLPPPPPVQPAADRLRAEAACRALRLLRREGGVPAAEIARRYAAFCAGPDADLPESAWTSRLSAEGVEVEGALLLRCEGELPVDTATLPPELRAVLDSSPAQPWALLRSLLTGQEHPGLPAAAWPLGVAALLPVALLGMTVAEAVEVLLLRSLLDLGRWLGTPELRLQAALGLGIFLVLRLCGEGALLSGAAWLGRQVEARARAGYLAALPRLRDRYLQSRLISDLAERGQLISFLGQLPGLALRGGGALLTLFFAAAGLIWVDPGLSPAVLGTVLLALVLPAL
ncbi:MAG TPA: cysteine peptidase family C39 domain-containing protein, partial [Myxococcota bacterium]|nr:cysteine peptidase family C39 domain-containing protein [Myxococcota bacterium]